jgi:hypothetical protein
VHIITLSSADDFVSIRDQILFAGQPRTVLIVPEFDRPELTSTDLALLRRLADRERLRVGLVTPDRQLRALAHDFGVPAFATVGAAGRKRGWRARPRQSLGLPPKG